MAVSLPCVLGVTTYNYQTSELQYTQAKEQLEIHMKYGHPAADGTANVNSRKPEKFPRPALELDTTEDTVQGEICPNWQSIDPTVGRLLLS